MFRSQKLTQSNIVSLLFILLYRPNWESMTDDTEQCATHIHRTGRVHSRAQPVRHAERSETLNKQTLRGRKKGSFSAEAGGGVAVSWLVVNYSYQQFNFGPQQECSFEIKSLVGNVVRLSNRF